VVWPLLIDPEELPLCPELPPVPILPVLELAPLPALPLLEPPPDDCAKQPSANIMVTAIIVFFIVASS
jgi:hypothetical protein